MADTQTKTNLSAEQHQQYKDDGYLIVDTQLPDEVYSGIIEDLGDNYNILARGNPRAQDAWVHSANVRRLARAPHILAILEELYARKPLPFQTLNYPIGTEQAPHQDTVHFNSIPSGYMCGVWVALEDMDMDNGPLVYFPGSHLFPEVIMSDVGVPSSLDFYSDYEKWIAKMIDEMQATPAYGTLKKGEALIWAAPLIHGGIPQRDKTRSRYSQVTHYFFEQCRYYTPMLSKDERIYVRNPLWITDNAPMWQDRLRHQMQWFDAWTLKNFVQQNMRAIFHHAISRAKTRG